MATPIFSQHTPAVTDVYTNVQGLQNLGKGETSDEALKKVAQQFESMFINLMLKSMRQANDVFSKDSLFNSKEGEFYRDMHDNQLSLTLAHSKGFGIAEALYRQMSRQYGDKIDKLTDSRASPGVGSSNFQTQATRTSIADSVSEFLQKIAPHVKKAAAALGVDPDILAAQSALETGWGKKVLADKQGKTSNNLFNIKRDTQWQGETLTVNTLEHKNGLVQAEKAEFKSYPSIEESAADYVQFLKQGSRYKKALESAGNSLEYIQQLQRAGYATDTKYAEKVYSVYSKIKALGGQER